MTSVRISVGTELSMGEKIFAVRQSLGNGILQLEAKLDGELRQFSRGMLVNALAKGEVHIHASNKMMMPLRKADLTALSKIDKNEVFRRWAYVKRIEKPGLALSGKKLVQAIIPMVAEEIGDVKPPSWQHLYRWLKLYRDAGRDICSLIPKVNKRGNRLAKLPPEVHDIIQRVIGERFLVDSRPRVSDVFSAVQVDISRLNQMRPEWEKLPMPNIRTLYREIDKLDRYTVLEGRYGKAIARRETRHVGEGVITIRPLERIEIDHTIMDVIVVDDDNSDLVYGRPTLTMVIDHFTRMPLGFYVGFTSPGTASVMMALRMALAPKEWVNEKYPDIKGKWPCYGVPETLITDNGAEFHSQDLELACMQLGIAIQHNKVKEPWTKGVVERFLGEISRSLLAQIPGKTFHKPDARGEYDSVKKACISITRLEEIICQWIVDVHSGQMHEGINAIPLKRWEEGVEAVPPRLFSSVEDLNVLLAGNQSEKTLNPRGVMFKGLWYNSLELTELRNSLPKSSKVDFKFDHMDLGQIHVLDPRTQQYLLVPAIDQKYAKGLGYWQHAVISRQYRKLRKAGVDLLSIAEAKESIYQKVQQSEKNAKKKKVSKSVGRFKEAAGTNETTSKTPTYSILPDDSSNRSLALEDWQYEDDFDDENEEFLVHDMCRIQRAVKEGSYE